MNECKNSGKVTNAGLYDFFTLKIGKLERQQCWDW